MRTIVEIIGGTTLVLASALLSHWLWPQPVAIPPEVPTDTRAALAAQQADHARQQASRVLRETQKTCELFHQQALACMKAQMDAQTQQSVDAARALGYPLPEDQAAR